MEKKQVEKQELSARISLLGSNTKINTKEIKVMEDLQKCKAFKDYRQNYSLSDSRYAGVVIDKGDDYNDDD